ncbi:uncharacterized protein LOC129239158 [Anastrepha obliqua]|uniref:uncharacterized protein LOC129239158 n=1 Tax=Anastrepha obliqua TaxID=95512 RepID=UPI00240A61A5|nr:uncharacterized protein LOC129239158 [Anastrepha obliqua]
MQRKPNDSTSSDSDDEDNEQMRQFLEAADTTLLTNAMFQPSLEERGPIKENLTDNVADTASEQKVLPSNRYLLEEEGKTDADFITTEAVKKHIGKKLSELIANSVEFGDLETPTSVQKTRKSRVILFTGAGCYVKPYEEFEFESNGPTKRPVIKRKKLDDHEKKEKQEDLYDMASVSAEDILSGKLTAGWAPKRERNDKLFSYKCDANGKLHLNPEENEFTKLRQKNHWNESKIKQKRNIISR